MASVDGPICLALLEALPMGVLILRLDVPSDDGSLRVVGANPAASAALGLDLRGCEGKRFFEVFPASHAERARVCAEAVRLGKAAQCGPFLRRDDGSAAHALSSQVVPLRHGCVAEVFESAASYRQSEPEIRRLNTFLDAIINHMPAMVFVKDAEHLRFEMFNRSGEALLGIRREDMLGKTDFDFFPPEQAAFFQAKDREVLAGGTLADIPEEPIDTPAGRRWLHTKKIPLADEAGTPRHLLGISLDITDRRAAQEELRLAHQDLERRVAERTADLARSNAELSREIEERRRAEETLRQTEEQLRHAQKMQAVGRLAGGVAHDFNNLLSIVLSYAGLILPELRLDDPIRTYVEEIERAGKRAADLTRQLLAFSRQQVLVTRVLDLNQVVLGIRRMLERLLGADVELVLLLSPEPCTIRADPGQIEQVIVNLAANARDAMPEGGKLTIETGELPGLAEAHVVLAVTDTGVGMDKETQSRIFEPFFTTKELGKGTGLGLSTVFGIVEQSGGHISVESQPGSGSSFRVTLPRVTGTSDAPLDAPPLQVLRGSETILLVEDDEQVRNLARDVLRRQGYRVLDSANAGDALLICEEHRHEIHLLLTDIVLPRMNGRRLAERLVAMRPRMKVLFMSGYSDEGAVRRGIGDAGMPFLQKPLTPDSLAHKVREVLGPPANRPASRTDPS